MQCVFVFVDEQNYPTKYSEIVTIPVETVPHVGDFVFLETDQLLEAWPRFASVGAPIPKQYLVTGVEHRIGLSHDVRVRITWPDSDTAGRRWGFPAELRRR